VEEKAVLAVVGLPEEEKAVLAVVGLPEEEKAVLAVVGLPEEEKAVVELAVAVKKDEMPEQVRIDVMRLVFRNKSLVSS
jgi:3'-phosphoadenosine 5'-phosphosulfate (PAPS) 3'-phosphatase